MAMKQPVTKLDGRFSSADAKPHGWAEARMKLDEAQVYWLTTVRASGRPHVTPLLAVWLDEALHFCAGPAEQKALNLQTNRRCVLTTGCNTLSDGLDLGVEGEAVEVNNEPTLSRLADAWAAKYEGWVFEVRDGAFYGDGGRALVYRVEPSQAFGFGKGETFSQTRWRF